VPALVAEPADQGLGIRTVVSVRCIGPELPQVICNHGYRVTQGYAAVLSLGLVAHRDHHSSQPAMAPRRCEPLTAADAQPVPYAPAAEQAGTLSCSKASRPQKLRSPTFQVPLIKTAWPCTLLSAG